MSAKREHNQHKLNVLNDMAAVDSDAYILKSSSKKPNEAQQLANSLHEVAKRDNDAMLEHRAKQSNVGVTQKAKRERVVVNKDRKEAMLGVRFQDSTGSMRVSEKEKPKKQVVQQSEDSVKAVQSKETTQSNKTASQESVKLSQVARGFLNLYASKTVKILNPVKFIADNLSKVTLAFILVAVPVLIALLLITQVPYVEARVIQPSVFMTGLYTFVLYSAITFIWFSFLFLVSFVYGMIKREVKEIAKLS